MMRILAILMLAAASLFSVAPRATAGGYYGGYNSYSYSYPSYSYGYSSYQYSQPSYPGYAYYAAGYYDGKWYPAGYYSVYTPPKINVAQFVPYLYNYGYATPYTTYQPPAALPAVALNAVAPVQAQARAADPQHDCKAETRALAEKLAALERRFAAPAATAPPQPQAPPPGAQAAPSPQAQAVPLKLDGGAVFAERCLKCHGADRAKAVGGNIALGDLTTVQLLGCMKQVIKGAMPKDKPLTEAEGGALLAYFDGLKGNDKQPAAKPEAAPSPK